MKKIFYITTVAVLINTANIFSQNQIALEHNGTVSLYYKLDSALKYSQKNDNIYLPGGSFDLGAGLTINKSVKIYGVGHYPDSTKATSASILNGNVFIQSGADTGAITGVYITGNVTFGTNGTNQVVNSYSISRCSMNYLWLSFDGSSTNNSQTIFISENVIRDELHGGNTTGCVIEKNIVTHHVRFFTSATFRNNIFLAQGHCCPDYPFTSTAGCLFENNIVRNTDASYMFQNGDFSGNTFNNNLFVVNLAYFPTILGNNNYLYSTNKVNVTVDSIFVSQSGSAFSYTDNYHLRPTSVGKNAGTDGKDIGIYGTANPYKEGAVPVNPHIISKSIQSTSSPSGKLNVNIKVGAQDR